MMITCAVRSCVTRGGLLLALAVALPTLAVAQPTTQNLSPNDSEAGVAPTPTLEIDCSSPGLVAAEFRIGDGPDLSMIVYSSGESPNDLCSHVVTASLASLTTYWWSARVQNSMGTWSAWSPATSFTTADGSLLFTNVFQDGVFSYDGTADADIRGSYVDPSMAIREWNQGAQDVLRTGRRPVGSSTDEIYRSLLRFDIQLLADPNAVVNAYIELTGWQHTSNDFFHRINTMYEMVKPWGEGVGITDSPPGPGEVSWTYAAFPDAWASPGASSASDSDPSADRKASPLVHLRVTNQVGYKTRWSSPALVDAVRRWIADPMQNAGVLIRADNESARTELNLASREHADPTYRPRLVVVSTEPANRPGNQIPVARDDQAFALIGIGSRINVLANDSDVDLGPDPVRILSVSTPGTGTAEIDAGQILYTPSIQFSGSDAFMYAITDGASMVTANVTIRDALQCRFGTVNAGMGPVVNVLFVNSSVGDANRVVTVGAGQPFVLNLDAAVAGPSPGRYATWVWGRPPQTPVDLRVHGMALGCLANPTPLQRNLRPQPIRCLRGNGVPSLACGSVAEPASPAGAPWTIMRSQGLLRPTTFTFQGLIEDDGAANATGFSVTNAVVLQVQ